MKRAWDAVGPASITVTDTAHVNFCVNPPDGTFDPTAVVCAAQSLLHLPALSSATGPAAGVNYGAGAAAAAAAVECARLPPRACSKSRQARSVCHQKWIWRQLAGSQAQAAEARRARDRGWAENCTRWACTSSAALLGTRFLGWERSVPNVHCLASTSGHDSRACLP